MHAFYVRKQFSFTQTLVIKEFSFTRLLMRIRTKKKTRKKKRRNREAKL